MKSKTLPFAAFEFDALEVYLENMAGKGYELQELEDEQAVFARVEKAVVSYRLDYCAGDADFDYMLEQYGALGWEHVLTGTGNRLVFRSFEAGKEKPPRLGNAEPAALRENKRLARNDYVYASLLLLVATGGIVAAIVDFRGSITSIWRPLGVYLYIFGLWMISRSNRGSHFKDKKWSNTGRRIAEIANAVMWIAAIATVLFLIVDIVFLLID